MINVGSRNGIPILKTLRYDNPGVYFLTVAVNTHILTAWDGRSNGNNVSAERLEHSTTSPVDGVEHTHPLPDL